MLSEFVKNRVYVFIDAANIFYTQRTLGWRISYEKLKRYFEEECKDNLGKRFVYTATDSERPQQKRFLDMLDNLKKLRFAIEFKQKSP